MPEQARLILGRLKWAAGMRRRRWPPAVWLRLAWHDFITHGLFGPGHEICQNCGRGYVLWHAEDDLWERVHGTPGGLLCPACFDRQALDAGVLIEFRAILFDRSF